MHKLSRRHVKQAEALATSDLTLKELGERAQEPGLPGDIAAWAVQLRTWETRRALGLPRPPGYSGGNHK